MPQSASWAFSDACVSGLFTILVDEIRRWQGVDGLRFGEFVGDSEVSEIAAGRTKSGGSGIGN
jgi:hypothetical protein